MTLTPTMDQWLHHIKIYRLPIVDQVLKRVQFSGRGVEIGAGSAWLSAVISQQPNVTQITTVEIDPERVKASRDFFEKEFSARSEKITHLVGDFHKLPFPDRSLDFVICDAALHHTENLPKLLAELNRVLVDDGLIVAIREPIVPSFWPLGWWRRVSFGWHQRRHGDIEKIYSLNEWRKNFTQQGFTLEVYPYSLNTTWKERIIRRLPALNTIFFGRTFFVARKTKSVS